MKSEDYIKKLYDFKVWFNYARQQKFVADQILQKCIMNPEFIRSMRSNEKAMDDYVSLWSNAHYHYGIGIENGLKGLIIKNKPELINVDESSGVLKNIGGSAGKSHNLLELAKTSGIFESKIFFYEQQEANYTYLNEVLSHLSDTIKWGARYPIPMNHKNIYNLKNGIPSNVIYGFHILDVIAPLFEHFEDNASSDDCLSINS